MRFIRSELCCRNSAGRLLAAALASAALAACTTVEFSDAPFRCALSDPEPRCPSGYQCDGRRCVTTSREIATLVSSNASEALGSFTLQRRGAGSVLCWQEALDARSPSLFGALLDQDGRYGGQPVELAVADASSTTALTGVASSCGVASDDRLVVAVVRVGLGSSLLASQYILDPAAPQQRTPLAPDAMFASRLSVSMRGLSQFYAATASREVAWAYPTNFNNNFESLQAIQMTRVRADLATTTTRLPVPLLETTEFVAATELLLGEGGLWLSVLGAGGRAKLAWVPSEATRAEWITAQPDGPVLATVPLAARGAELVVAYKTEDTAADSAWTLRWFTPGAFDAATGIQRGATAAEGPTLRLAPGISRVGGALTDAGDLVLAAAASDGSITVWSVPWRGTAASPLGTIERISRLPPLMLDVVAVGSGAQVAWTEHVASSADRSAVTLLYAGMARARR